MGATKQAADAAGGAAVLSNADCRCLAAASAGPHQSDVSCNVLQQAVVCDRNPDPGSGPAATGLWRSLTSYAAIQRIGPTNAGNTTTCIDRS